MTAGGFVMVSREALAAIGADPITLAVYVELCRRARWEGPATTTTSHGVIKLEVGQCVVGRADLADATGATEQQVRTALTRIVKHEIATIESTKRGSIVTLGRRRASVEPAGGEQPSKRPSSNQAPTTTYIQRSGSSSSSDPSSDPPGDPGSARLGPKAASGADPDAVAEYERLRELGGWGVATLPGLRVLAGGGGDS